MTTATPTPEVAPAAFQPPLSHRRRAGTEPALAVAVAVLVVGLGVPYAVTDAYTMSLALDAAILSLLALGIGFLARHLGLISLGHTSFFGGAAYTVGIASTHWSGSRPKPSCWRSSWACCAFRPLRGRSPAPTTACSSTPIRAAPSWA